MSNIWNIKVTFTEINVQMIKKGSPSKSQILRAILAKLREKHLKIEQKKVTQIENTKKGDISK